MKKQLTIIGLVLLVGVAVVAVLLMTSKKTAADECTKTGTTYSITIKNDKVSQSHIDAKQCDVLKITNLDSETREIAFGPHEDHVPYNGIAERVLGKNQGFSVVLNATGNYRFHDHIHDEVQATFTVTKS